MYSYRECHIIYNNSACEIYPIACVKEYGIFPNLNTLQLGVMSTRSILNCRNNHWMYNVLNKSLCFCCCCCCRGVSIVRIRWLVYWHEWVNELTCRCVFRYGQRIVRIVSLYTHYVIPTFSYYFSIIIFARRKRTPNTPIALTTRHTKSSHSLHSINIFLSKSCAMCTYMMKCRPKCAIFWNRKTNAKKR